MAWGFEILPPLDIGSIVELGQIVSISEYCGITRYRYQTLIKYQSIDRRLDDCSCLTLILDTITGVNLSIEFSIYREFNVAIYSNFNIMTIISSFSLH